MKIGIFIGVTAIFVLVFLSLNAFPGYPNKELVEKQTPFIEFLMKKTENNRIFGLDGILNQMFNSVYKISDLRNTAPLLIKTYQNFIRHNVVITRYNDLDQSFITNYFYTPSNKTDTDHFIKFKKNTRKALDFTGTKYFITPNKLNGHWFEKIYPDLFVNTHLVYSDPYVNIYQNKSALARAFFVNHVVYSETYQEAQHLLMNSTFDMYHIGILEEPVAENLNFKKFNANANIIQYKNNSVTIKTVSDHDALLILTDIYYPGWTALVDGKKTKIYRVDGLVRGVIVPAGQHEIKFYYFPMIFKIGLIIASFAIILCIFLSL